MKPFLPVLAVAFASSFAAAPGSAAVLFDSSNSVNADIDGTSDIDELSGNNVTIAVSGNVVDVTSGGGNGGLGRFVASSNLNGPNQGALGLPDDGGEGRTFELSYDLFIPAGGGNFRRDVPFVLFFDGDGEFGSNNVQAQGFGQGGDPSITGEFQTVSYSGLVPTTRGTESFDAQSAKFRILFEQNGEAGNNGEIAASLRNVRFDVTPVPEPASLALLGLGGVALMGRRRA